MKNWKNYAIAALVAIVIILLVRGLSNNKPLPVKPEITSVKDHKKELAAAEQKAAKKIDSLQAVVSTERKKTEGTVAVLKKYQARARDLERTLTKVLNTEPSEPFVSGAGDYADSSDTRPKTDSAALVELILNSQARDSLCNEAITSQKTQLDTKDSIAVEKDKLYLSLKTQFNKALTDQQKLEDYSKDLKKRLKSSRAGNKIWKGAAVSAGLFILKTIFIKK